MKHLDYTLSLDTATSGYDGRTFWGHARAGAWPGDARVITMSKTRQGGSDIFETIHDMRSRDNGATWSDPVPREGLGRFETGDGLVGCPCDPMPAYHAASGKMLLTGHLAFYEGDHLAPGTCPRRTWWSVCDGPDADWTQWRGLETPLDDGPLFNSGAGSTQRVDLPDGDILLPIYYRPNDPDTPIMKRCHTSTVLRCGFDGDMLRYKAHGSPVTLDVPRGCCEPSLAAYDGRYFMTIRNDERGYVTVSHDGLDFGDLVPWRFDDGEELGNYNTQQHWITRPDGLFLVYTRRGLDNDHVMRHRAPVVMAQVDPSGPHVVRETERIVVPERGARLGNFATVNVSDTESWVVVSEWMQGPGPDPFEIDFMLERGADNSVFVARITWSD